MEVIRNKEVDAVFDNYPDEVREQMVKLRLLVLSTAEEIPEVKSIKETLRWGEPSYITKIGSTLRMDWKPKQPEQFALYFKCTSKLIPSIKAVFGETFQYEKNRAIVFKLGEEIPPEETRRCIEAALTYHKRKKETFLGL